MPSLTKARADHNTFDDWQCCVKRLISHPKCCCLGCSGEGIPHQMPCSRWTLNGNTSNSCDAQNCNRILRPIEEPTRITPTVAHICDPSFVPSSLGTHAALRMSARREHHLLLIRILIGLFSKVVLRDFLRLHLAGLKVETMPPCGHNTSRSLSVDSFGVFPTSVIAPLAPEHVLYGVIWENVKVYNPWIYQLTVRLLTCFLYPQPNSC